MKQITAHTPNVTRNKSESARACGDDGLNTGLMMANKFIVIGKPFVREPAARWPRTASAWRLPWPKNVESERRQRQTCAKMFRHATQFLPDIDGRTISMR
jgi:hypothetical protein